MQHLWGQRMSLNLCSLTFHFQVNPYTSLPLYDQEHIQMYHSGKGFDTPPHVFKLAEQAYSNVCADGTSQAVIISGESGAGKVMSLRLPQHIAYIVSLRVYQLNNGSFRLQTEAAKLLLNYVSAVSGTSSASAQHIKT